MNIYDLLANFLDQIWLEHIDPEVPNQNKIWKLWLSKIEQQAIISPYDTTNDRILWLLQEAVILTNIKEKKHVK